MPVASARLLLFAGSVAGAVVCAWLAAYAWRRRDVPPSRPFVGVMVAATLWSIAYAGVLLADPPVVAALLATADVAAAQIGPLWVVFAIVYTGLDRYRRPAVYAVLWAVPIAYAGLVVTAPLHDFVALGVEYRTVAGVTAPTLVRDLPYWVSVGVSYLFVLIGFALLVRFLLVARPVYRRQAAAIVGGGLLPLVANLVFVVGVGSRTGIDPTPLAFAIGGLVAGWALFRSDFLSVAPLAGDVLLDDLPDPVFVLDPDGRIVEHNDAAVDTIGETGLIGRHVETVAPGLLDRVEADDPVRAPDGDGSGPLFDPQVTPVTDRHGERRGRLIVLRDVTVQQRRLDRVEALQATTERLIEARIDDEVAEIAVSFVEGVLGQDVAVVFFADGDRLRPAAISTALEESLAEPAPDVPPGSPLFAHYERGQTAVLPVADTEWVPFEMALDGTSVLALSLGEHGLLCIAGERGGEYSAEDRQFATILAGATATALDRVSREQQLRKFRGESLAVHGGDEADN